MAKSFPPDQRRPNVSWSIHKELLTIPDEAERQIWLDKAEESFRTKGCHISIQVLRKLLIRRVSGVGEGIRKAKQDARKNLTIPLNEANRQYIFDLAALYEPTLVPGNIKDKAASLMVDIFIAYVDRNRPELKAKLKAYKDGDRSTVKLPDLLYHWKRKTVELSDEQKRVLAGEHVVRKAAYLESLRNKAAVNGSVEWYRRRNQARFRRQELMKPEPERRKDIDEMIKYWEEEWGMKLADFVDVEQPETVNAG